MKSLILIKDQLVPSLFASCGKGPVYYIKKALITGITGQDGSYLAEILLKKGYKVHSIIRRSSSLNTDRIDQIYQDPHVNGARMILHYGDLCDAVQMVVACPLRKRQL